MKKYFFLLLLLPLFFLAACSSEETSASLDPRFDIWFNPTEAELAGLAGGIDTPNIRVEYDDATIYLRQIMGNAHVLYLAVDVIGSDVFINRVEFPSLYHAGELRSPANGVMLHNRPDLFSGYIIRLFSEQPLDTGEELVMRLGAIQDIFDFGPENTLFGPYEISFVPTVNSPVREMSLINDDGEYIGTLSVSALHAHLTFLETNPQLDAHDFTTQTPIRIVMEDGTSRTIWGATILAQPEEDGSDRWWSIWSEHRRLWEPNQIVAIEIGDIRVDVN